jgi:hypothetical protein
MSGSFSYAVVVGEGIDSNPVNARGENFYPFGIKSATSLRVWRDNA